jgi:hypothetical protein
MHITFKTTLTLGALLLAASTAAAQQSGGTPTPVSAVKRACDARGGLDAFRTLGIVGVRISREEVTQNGQATTATKTLYFLAPGPIPGRTEDQQLRVIAGDDGSGGWAVVGGQADSRPSTNYMVRRLLQWNLFPLLLPFSLTWDGVTVADVAAATVDGQPVWRLKVELSRTFFHTPQISTSWIVDLDRKTFVLVRAQSPATDLGKGIKADGMLFGWSEPVKLGGVLLPAVQRVTGLDEGGIEKSHSRVDHITYKQMAPQTAEELFANPIPPDQRLKPPSLQPPAGQPHTKPGV